MGAVISNAIPYRSDPVIGGGEMLWILLVTLGLLALVATILLQLRRRGWLDAWASGKPFAGGVAARRWQVHSQRISRRSVLHTLECEERSLLVVESPSGVAIVELSSAVDCNVPGERSDVDQ